MARQNLIKHIRSAVQHNVPTTSQLELGEIALNTQDGKIFIHQTDGITPSIVEIGIGEVFQLTDFNGHVHSVSLTGQQAYNLIKDGDNVLVRSSSADAHFHEVTVTYDAANKTFDASTISGHTGHSFATSGGGLPAQTSNGGKFLSTNGTTTSWENLPATLTVRDVSGNVNVADVFELRFDDNTGFNLTDLTGGAVQVALGSHWKDLLVNGQTTLTPSGEESLEIVAGSNVVITTDETASPKKLTIGLEEGVFIDSEQIEDIVGAMVDANTETNIIVTYNDTTDKLNFEVSDLDWANITNKPTTFTPSAHTHTIADTTGLQTALDGKTTETYVDEKIASIDLLSSINNISSNLTTTLEAIRNYIMIGPTITVSNNAEWVVNGSGELRIVDL